LPIAWISFDDAIAYEAGMLVAATKSAGLSFGDRACLALARRLRLPVMTADRAWSSIASTVGVTVDLIR
jgi:PIN domain nuclease of toxin-antitoxin system